jgi:ribosome-binding factor A
MASQIKQIAASTLLYASNDPALSFVNITEVRLTGDLQNATIFWTALGDDVNKTRAASSLAKVTGRVRSEVAHKIGSRLAPTIRFEEDLLDAQVSSIEDILAKAAHEDGKLHSQRESARFAGEENPYKETPNKERDAV